MLAHDNAFGRRNLGTVVSEVLVLVVSALVFSMAFPGLVLSGGFGALAFVSLIPLFAVIRRTTWALTPFYGFLFGFVFYLMFNYWLKTFHPLAILIVPIIKGGEMVFLFLALKAADRWFRSFGYLTQAFAWLAYTYVSQSWFAGYPYGMIGYALYQYRILIQIADITGIWGINFLMILPQTFLGAWVGDRWRGTFFTGGRGIFGSGEEYFRPGKPKMTSASLSAYLKDQRLAVIIYAALVLGTLVYGAVSLSTWNAMEPDRLWRVAAVQHNSDSWKGGYDQYKKNFNIMRRMSLEALRYEPDMIIWSETAFVPSVSWHTQYPSDQRTAALVDEFLAFGKSLPVPLLTGNPEGVLANPDLPPLLENGEWNRADYNGVLLFEDGEVKDTYRKQHLVPFTEHFPYEKQMPWLYNLLLANDYNWWEKGTESTVFETADGVRFSTPICFEDVFGYLTAAFVRTGADVIVNMTNDSWSQAVSAEVQHVAMAVFRSVETRRSTIRGTNSGITTVITPTGRMVNPMPPFVEDWRMYEVPVYTADTYGNTPYTRYGDTPMRLISMAVVIFMALAAAWQAGEKIVERRKK
ncbi:apolipoprotein N-acyltransferase [Parasphaerochaeta coccoides]|uniref:Apolipoprotein N-acyltransferase n=1 Tax=Parasphaerochaeta coccoides (strain ATCC BAA-1237 / DSM 17374 / SPN1) TaxID=760011 RepID=F4GLQ3_PARC1|nr:apolipoprotein N-acyltransferase [Parasphaerochaeta coccoides]AEC02447.1 Apolipoprotein N-acyltransferase [Parasphaerochaeta coccoides DSM 17374]